MSEVLDAFVEPFRDPAHESVNDIRTLLLFGMLAWNIAILPEAKRPALLDEAYRRIETELGQVPAAFSRELLNVLVERKLRNFAQNQRMILSVELTNTGDRLRIDVVSTPPLPLD